MHKKIFQWASAFIIFLREFPKLLLFDLTESTVGMHTKGAFLLLLLLYLPNDTLYPIRFENEDVPDYRIELPFKLVSERA